MEAKARVLIVEDEVIVAKDIEAMLRSLGYAVCGIVRTGEEGVTRATQEEPDLVVMDIGLKGEIDGVEAARQIKAQGDLPVVYVTAITDQVTFQRAKETDPYGVIYKPFEENHVRGIVELALHQSRRFRRLRMGHRLLGAALDWMVDALVLADERVEVAFLNAAAEGLTGWRQQEAVGLPLAQVLVSAPGRPVEALCSLRPDMVDPTPCAFTLHARDARQLPVEGTMHPLVDRRRTEVGYLLRLRPLAEPRGSAAVAPVAAIRGQGG